MLKKDAVPTGAASFFVLSAKQLPGDIADLRPHEKGGGKEIADNPHRQRA